jgi:Holliday junction resolvasome RuvABC ATP-dependent DNA helicase subunit
MPLDDLTAEVILCDSVSDETPESLRRKILARDGYSCRHCGCASELHVHHIQFRSNGGRTEPTNLLALCRRCHALVHEEFLLIAGEAPHALTFTDNEGRPIEALTPESPSDAGVRVVKIEPRGARAPRTVSEVIDLQRVPNPVPHEFVAAHGARFTWNPSSKSLEFASEDVSSTVTGSDVPPPQHRPVRLDDIVGQERVVTSLSLALMGASKARKPLDPILLTGEPGLGKTALAHALAAEMGTTARVVSAPLVADAGGRDLVLELIRLAPGAVLFIDEIHALPRAAMEALYEAIEDRRLTANVRAGTSIRELTFDLPAFTLVAATNEPEKLPRALVSRFAIRERLESYSEDALTEIVKRTAAREGRPFTDEAGRRVIARAARGTPREAVLLTKRLIAAADAVLWKRLDKGI